TVVLCELSEAPGFGSPTYRTSTDGMAAVITAIHGDEKLRLQKSDDDAMQYGLFSRVHTPISSLVRSSSVGLGGAEVRELGNLVIWNRE
ncbi:hypothetical protein LTR56_028217, partial [Elasticomyces elasticus]